MRIPELRPFEALLSDRHLELAQGLHGMVQERDAQWQREVDKYRDILAQVISGQIDPAQVMFTDGDVEIMSLDLVMPDIGKKGKNGKSAVSASA